jgi:hypothetical protein
MLLKTHDIFTAGVLSLTGSLITGNPGFAVFTAFVISLTSNFTIDYFGHENKWINGIKRPVRTYKTHSFLRCAIYGFMPAAALYAFFFYAGRHGSYPFIRTGIGFILIQGVLAGPSHLLLDWPTEGGIFVKSKGRWVRNSLAHFKYNNFLVNAAASLAGVICFLPLLASHISVSGRYLYILKHFIKLNHFI